MDNPIYDVPVYIKNLSDSVLFFKISLSIIAISTSLIAGSMIYSNMYNSNDDKNIDEKYENINNSGNTQSENIYSDLN